jgi:DNA-binding IclR family transcriptional regulator
MSAGVSISKSVARAFRLLELYAEVRRPLTAAELGRRLELPQPSVRALVKTLAALGYLDYQPMARTYLPGRRLAQLAQWLPAAVPLTVSLRVATDRVAELANETASLSTLVDGHAEILHVRRATHPVALQLEPGPGAPAWRTAVGRVLLAQCPAERVATLLAGWLKQERAAGRRTLQLLPRELARIRRDGHYVAYDLLLEGVGAVCCPVPGATVPLALAVAGANDRIRPRAAQLLKLVRTEMRRAKVGDSPH